jgi:hypothetical protein
VIVIITTASLVVFSISVVTGRDSTRVQRRWWRDEEVRWSFPGTPQISTLLKQDQPARKEAIVRFYASGFPSASVIRHRTWLMVIGIHSTFCSIRMSDIRSEYFLAEDSAGTWIYLIRFSKQWSTLLIILLLWEPLKVMSWVDNLKRWQEYLPITPCLRKSKFSLVLS